MFHTGFKPTSSQAALRRPDHYTMKSVEIQDSKAIHKKHLADFLIQALKQGALGILATVSRVLTSAKQILKEGFKAFSWVFEFHFYDTYEQSYLPFCVPIHFRFKLEQNVREKRRLG